MDQEAARLTGLWSGLYSYPAGLAPVFFVATLISHGGHFSGSSQEASEGAAGAPLTLGAALVGRAGGGAVDFTKTYDGTGGWRHAVRYAGRLSADGREIEGIWTIPGVWGGRFLMMRGERAEESELREAFVRA